MSIVSNISSWFANVFGRPNKNIYSSLINLNALEVFAPIDGKNAITNGFEGNTSVYSIVMKDATKFGTIPRYVYQKATMEQKDLPDNIIQGPLTDLLNRPNPYQSQDSFFTALRAFYKVTGEAFVWLNRGDVQTYTDNYNVDVTRTDEQIAKMPVLEMYVLPSNLITIVPDPDNLWGCIGYILDVAGRRIPINKVDVIHWKSTNLDFNPVNRVHLRGMSPLTPGAKTLQQNIDATRASVRMYQNDGAKGALANETMNALTPVQMSQLKEVIDSKINNYDIKGAVATLQGKWNYLNFGGTSIDLQLLEGKELSWKELCFLFGVPFEFFDSKTTFANKEQAQNGWVSNEIIPACRQFDGELNRQLLPAFGLENTGFIGSDFTELMEAQRDIALTVTAMATAWWLTPNEKRQWMNEEPYDDPSFDEPWIPAGTEPLSQIQDSFNMQQTTQDLMNQTIGEPKPAPPGKKQNKAKKRMIKYKSDSGK